MKSIVGNDLVDLTLSELVDKHKNSRFVERVLTSSEQRLLMASESPERLLWYFWSAKEAAYKALKKYSSKIIFSPANLEVTMHKTLSRGSIRYEEIEVDLFWHTSPEWIHCSAIISIDKVSVDFDFKVMHLGEVWDRSHQFTERERLSIHSDGSKAVRVLAKTLLYQKGIERVEIVRRPLGKKYSPPEIYYKSKRINTWDLSMSHDGEYVACLIAH